MYYPSALTWSTLLASAGAIISSFNLPYDLSMPDLMSYRAAWLLSLVIQTGWSLTGFRNANLDDGPGGHDEGTGSVGVRRRGE